MNILGISGGVRPGNQDASATLVCDGRVAAAAEEERFNRIKHSPGTLPENAVRWCLSRAGLDIRDVDLVVFPGATYERMAEIITGFFRFRFGHAPPVELYDHHRSHAWGAWLCSGFPESMVITADLSGDSRSTVLYRASGGEMKEVAAYSKPDSLGLFYAALTQYLGFNYDNDECKVMALAALGKPDIDLDWFLGVGRDGYRLDAAFLDPRIMAGSSNPSRQEFLLNEKFTARLGRPPRRAGEPFTPFHADLAASAQRQLENAFLALLARLRRACPGVNALCLAGGVALNAELNSRLLYSGGLERLFVQPVAGDAGLSMGAAMHHAFRRQGVSPGRLETLALGPRYTGREVRAALDGARLPYTRCRAIEKKVARALNEGKTVAFFQGGMEFGPRALGNRSILAPPFSARLARRLNRRLKTRETFQPFAPSVTAAAAGFFDFPATEADFDFMIINVRARGKAKRIIPGVVHRNGTARVQLVNPGAAPVFHRVLSLFGRESGVPVLLNTSLNLRGEPIARTPADALRVFAASPVDCLALEDCWLEKNCRQPGDRTEG